MYVNSGAELTRLSNYFGVRTKTGWLSFGLLSCFFGLAILGAWWLGKGPWLYPTQVDSSLVLEQKLTGNTIIGQTLVASQAGLQQVQVRLAQLEADNAPHLTLQLYEGPDKQTLLRQVTSSIAGAERGSFLVSF